MKLIVILLAFFIVIGLKLAGHIHITWLELFLPILCIIVYTICVLVTHHAVDKVKKLFKGSNHECKYH